MDLHHNLFYSYRGPSADDADRDRQLENNLTKALVNTLSLGGDGVWRPFLAWLGLEDVSAAKFLLQRCDLPTGIAARRRERTLLGISKKSSAWTPGQGAELTYENVPDAWIYGNGFAVLVESKVNDADFVPEQMQAHLARLRAVEQPPPTVALKTWAEIHGFFRGLLPGLTDCPSAKLLAEQFIQFLEYSGMSEFIGFRLDHFQYFLLHDDDDGRRWIHDQVRYFATRVHASLREFAPFYEAYDVGTLKLSDSYCWVAFGPSNDGYRHVTHQTMALGADGLKVFVNAELKAATDRLKSVLKQSGTIVRQALQHLHAFEPFELVLEERLQRQASLYDYTSKMRLHSSMLDQNSGDVAWNAFVETVNRLPLPYLRIERLVPAQKLIELSKSDASQVVQYVVQILRQNHAAVRLLNQERGEDT